MAFSARYTLALLNLVRLMMVDTVALSGLQVSTSMMVLTAASSVSIGLAHDLTAHQVGRRLTPFVRQIEKRLRKLGCTKEQVSRHLDQVTKSRTQSTQQKRSKNRPHRLDWP